MVWIVEFGEDIDREFDREFDRCPRCAVCKGAFTREVRSDVGTTSCRYFESRYANMKEMRFDAADGVWRVAFAFDRRAILLVAGDKSGGSQQKFYKTLIQKADKRFEQHLKKFKR